MKTTLKDLIDAGTITYGLKVLKLTYKNTTVKIDLDKDGTLKWNNQSFHTPSNFSLNFKRRITPEVQSDNGFRSIVYGGKPLNKYVKIYKIEMELEIMKVKYKLFCGKYATEILDEVYEEPDTEINTSECKKSPVAVGSMWDYVNKNGTVSSVTVNKIYTRVDGSHRMNLVLKPLNGVNKPRMRTVCDSKINENLTSYELNGYTQEASCVCKHCYTKYMGRQWSNELREKIKGAILHGTRYEKYEPLLGAPRDLVIDHLMTGLRNRHPNCESLTFEDAMNGKHSVKFQIDEIIPRAEFQKGINVNKVDEWTRIFNFKNIQLLTPDDNYGKGGYVQRNEDWCVFNNILSSEDARRVIIESRLSWIERRAKKGLHILEIEGKFCETYK